MDAVDLLLKPWHQGVSKFELASNGQDFIDITACVDRFDVRTNMAHGGMQSAELSFWYESPNRNTTEQLFLFSGEPVFEFKYQYYPDGKDAPYCEGRMILLKHSPNIHSEVSHFKFIISGKPAFGGN